MNVTKLRKMLEDWPPEAEVLSFDPDVGEFGEFLPVTGMVYAPPTKSLYPTGSIQLYTDVDEEIKESPNAQH